MVAQTHNGQHGEARSLVVVDQQPFGPSKKEKSVFQAALSGKRKERHEGMASTGARTWPVTHSLGDATLGHLRVKRDNGS